MLKGQEKWILLWWWNSHDPTSLIFFYFRQPVTWIASWTITIFASSTRSQKKERDDLWLCNRAGRQVSETFWPPLETIFISIYLSSSHNSRLPWQYTFTITNVVRSFFSIMEINVWPLHQLGIYIAMYISFKLCTPGIYIATTRPPDPRCFHRH